MLKVQLLKLPVVAPEKKPDPIWTGLKVADRSGWTSSGFCESGDASQLVAAGAAQRKGHSSLMFMQGRFVSVETFQTVMVT